jgi:N-acetylglucosaminyldiphosphoundecaprenol N-acetyl-beta-D-mannosaminyltransferase
MKPEAPTKFSPSCPSPGVLVSVPNFLPGETPFDARTQHFDDLSRNVYGVMGIPVDVVDFTGVTASIEAAAQSRQPYLISTPNVNFLIASRTDPTFREALLISELCPADGAPIVVIARMLGVPITTRIAGSDTFDRLRQNKTGKPLDVFLFGGTDEAAAILCSLLNQGGGMRCVGRLNPGFGTVEDLSKDHILDQINDSSADLLAVFLSSSKAQGWLLRNHSRLRTPVRFDFGGTINFQAGLVRRAPLRVRQIGLEWLWRIKEEPYLWRRYWSDGLELLAIMIRCVLPMTIARLWRDMSKVRALHLDQDQRESSSLLRLRGDAVATHIDSATIFFRQACALRKPLLLDLTEIRTIDPRFFGLLLMVRKQIRSQGLSLTFVGVTRKIHRLFSVNGFGFLLESQSQ